MFSRLHNRLGTAGLVVAVVALVAALAGTAFAATKLNGTQKKEVEKIAKKFAGKNGKDGTNGAPGANGKDGTNGAPGAEGKSVEAESASVAKCVEGGTVFKIGGVEKGKACNGEEGIQGEPGEDGSPWTAGGVLPKAATETGTWGSAFTNESVAPISFPVPLSAALAGIKAIIVPIAGSNASCDNGVAPAASVANPEADEGFLCVFVGALEGTAAEASAVVDPSTFGSGAGKTGALVLLGATGAGLGVGTFAVTGS